MRENQFSGEEVGSSNTGQRSVAGGGRTPLIERIDSPDDSLNKDLVLIHRDETSERLWCELAEHD